MNNSSIKLGNNTFLKNLVKDPIPTKILYIDTSFIMTALLSHPKSDKKKVCETFISRLIKNKISIAFSSILHHEVIVAAIDNEIQKALGSSKSGARKQILDNPNLLVPHKGDIDKTIKSFLDILSKFEGRNFAISPTEAIVVNKTLEVKCKYSLDLADAIHLGTMLSANQRNIASFDKDFKAVDGLNIWCRYF